MSSSTGLPVRRPAEGRVRVAVTGANGQVGRELLALLRSKGHTIFPSDLPDMDIGDEAVVARAMASAAPDVIVNCAAYTDVDGCEQNRDLAMRVNRDGPANLSRAARSSGAILVHYSTDFVFDGASARPYTEADAPNPISAYGESKLAGDEAVQREAPRHLIVRTSWVYGHGAKNFVLAIARQVLAGATQLRVVSDQTGSPTFARDIAEATLRLLERGATGLVNFCNSDECSRLDYAHEIARLLRGDEIPEMIPVSSGDLSAPARRPAYSTLDCSLYRSLTGIAPRPWQEALREYLIEAELTSAHVR